MKVAFESGMNAGQIQKEVYVVCMSVCLYPMQLPVRRDDGIGLSGTGNTPRAKLIVNNKSRKAGGI